MHLECLSPVLSRPNCMRKHRLGACIDLPCTSSFRIGAELGPRF